MIHDAGLASVPDYEALILLSGAFNDLAKLGAGSLG